MKKIKVLLSVLFVAGMFAVFAGCDHGNVNNHPEDVPQNLNPNDDPQTDPSSNPSSDPSTDPMTGYQYVGKKKPSEKKVVGDIVYFDGSATNIFSKDSHTGRNCVLESDFYAATTGSAQGHAVAYIFYAGEDGALGIGLEPERTEWTSIQTKASQYHTKYYRTDDVVRRMFTPEALKSGRKVPSKADLEKMLEDIDAILDNLDLSELDATDDIGTSDILALQNFIEDEDNKEIEEYEREVEADESLYSEKIDYDAIATDRKESSNNVGRDVVEYKDDMSKSTSAVVNKMAKVD